MTYGVAQGALSTRGQGRDFTAVLKVRRDVHAAITTSLERDWPPTIQGRIDRGAIQTQ
ncbi:hypothetical protein ACFRFU_46915 [Streptomyces sp. NPDC056704]|uniref:hypothetical protein n=1 Tax=Streptomyces sp. NPDC056704 TaxID=3345917 RepID=UPI00369FFE33